MEVDLGWTHNINVVGVIASLSCVFLAVLSFKFFVSPSPRIWVEPDSSTILIDVPSAPWLLSTCGMRK